MAQDAEDTGPGNLLRYLNLVSTLEKDLPALTDHDFTSIVQLVEMHRMRRLSMRVAVPWVNRVGEPMSPLEIRKREGMFTEEHEAKDRE